MEIYSDLSSLAKLRARTKVSHVAPIQIQWLRDSSTGESQPPLEAPTFGLGLPLRTQRGALWLTAHIAVVGGNSSSTLYNLDYPPFTPETTMQHRRNSGGVGGGSTGYGPQEYFQRAEQMQMETDQMQAPAMGLQNSGLWRQAADVQPQEHSAPHPSEPMQQMVMKRMAAMSEQLALLQEAQNVYTSGPQPKAAKETWWWGDRGNPTGSECHDYGGH